MNKINQAESVELFGTGNETRVFIHIYDLYNTIELIINKSLFNCDHYNIANGIGIPIIAIVKIVSDQFTNKNIFFNCITREGDPTTLCKELYRYRSNVGN